jgi:hypothetical protein
MKSKVMPNVNPQKPLAFVKNIQECEVSKRIAEIAQIGRGLQKLRESCRDYPDCKRGGDWQDWQISVEIATIGRELQRLPGLADICRDCPD